MPFMVVATSTKKLGDFLGFCTFLVKSIRKMKLP